MALKLYKCKYEKLCSENKYWQTRNIRIYKTQNSRNAIRILIYFTTYNSWS